MTVEGVFGANQGPGQTELTVAALEALASRAAAVRTVGEARAFATELARAQAGELPPAVVAVPAAPPPPQAQPQPTAFAAAAPPSALAQSSFSPQPPAYQPAPTGGTPPFPTTTSELSQTRIAETGAAPYAPLIVEAANRYGIEPALLFGLIEQESGFNPNAQSSAGASGLTQLMPGTAASLGVANPFDPREAIEGGARYLAQLLAEFNGNVEEALAAYNAGPGAVRAAGGVPPIPETQAYVAAVLANAKAFRG